MVKINFLLLIAQVYTFCKELNINQEIKKIIKKEVR